MWRSEDSLQKTKLSFYPVGDTEEETSGRGVTEAAHSVASHSPGEIQKPEEQKLVPRGWSGQLQIQSRVMGLTGRAIVTRPQAC